MYSVQLNFCMLLMYPVPIVYVTSWGEVCCVCLGQLSDLLTTGPTQSVGFVSPKQHM